MEAANRGACEAGGKTVDPISGCLSNPQSLHHPGAELEFHYFFMRKFWFAYLAKALVVFPAASAHWTS